jgi:hypothetical protein
VGRRYLPERCGGTLCRDVAQTDDGDLVALGCSDGSIAAQGRAALAIRTGSLLAALTVATSVAARMGEIEVASWQITMQLFLFLALTLDAIAIAAQAIIGRALGSTSPTRAISGIARA